MSSFLIKNLLKRESLPLKDNSDVVPDTDKLDGCIYRGDRKEETFIHPHLPLDLFTYLRQHHLRFNHQYYKSMAAETPNTNCKCDICACSVCYEWFLRWQNMSPVQNCSFSCQGTIQRDVIFLLFS